MARISAVCFCLFLGCSLGYSQVTSTVSSTTASSDPQAITLANQAMHALTGGAPISDVTLTGTTTETVGPTENTGTATLEAKGTSESRFDSQASQRHEIRNVDSSGGSQGAWIGADGVTHMMALHNSWTDAAWFFPALSSLARANQPGMVASYVGQETREGIAVQHIRIQQNVGGNNANAATLIAQLSTVDFYLDATSSLPVACVFNVHPDNDASVNFPVEIRYADYRSVNGVPVPFHLQKLMQGGLVLDFEASTVTINSGLTDSNFITN